MYNRPRWAVTFIAELLLRKHNKHLSGYVWIDRQDNRHSLSDMSEEEIIKCLTSHLRYEGSREIFNSIKELYNQKK